MSVKTDVMSGKKAAAGRKEPTIVVADDPGDRKGALKFIGGSRSDNWNNVLANQAVQTLWRGNSDVETRDRQYGATVAGLVGIGPRDELEGMLAAQLLGSHNAAMECYRRAMIADQTFEGHCENLSQANKLSRTYAILLDALNRHRCKGQQKVTVEHGACPPRRHAIVGAVNSGGGGENRSEGQPHPPPSIAYEPGTPLRSPDTTGTRAGHQLYAGKFVVGCMTARTAAAHLPATETPCAMADLRRRLWVSDGKSGLC